jgi:RNA polymerase sigma factor (sigma-70 family)
MTKSVSLARPTSAVPNESRLKEVAERYYAPLRAFFRRRTRNSPEVPDLVQQVFLRLTEHPHLSAIENPDAYVFQMAANALRDHDRRTRVRRRYMDSQTAEEHDAAYVVPSDLSPERIVQGRETIERVVIALRELPERTRDIFVLRCFEGLKHTEIARLQGISVRATEKHFAKALAYLSELVDRPSRPP